MCLYDLPKQININQLSNNIVNYVEWCDKQKEKSIFCELPDGSSRTRNSNATTPIVNSIAQGASGTVVSSGASNTSTSTTTTL